MTWYEVEHCHNVLKSHIHFRYQWNLLNECRQALINVRKVDLAKGSEVLNDSAGTLENG